MSEKRVGARSISRYDECETKFCSQKYAYRVEWFVGDGISAFVQTSDCWYVFVRLSGRSTNNNAEDCVGGVVGDELVVHTGQDLYRSFEIELEQEVAVPAEAIQENILLGVYVGPHTNVGCHFSTLLKDTRREVEQRFRVLGEDQDIHSLVFVAHDALEDKVEDMGGYKPFVYKELHEHGR